MYEVVAIMKNCLYPMYCCNSPVDKTAATIVSAIMLRAMLRLNVGSPEFCSNRCITGVYIAEANPRAA